MTASCLYDGTVTHQRSTPVPHAFTYPLFFVYVDLAEWDSALDAHPLWSSRGPAWVWLRRADFLTPHDRPLDVAVRERVAAALGWTPRGPIRLLTHPRYLGLSFNPVSFYFCFAEDGATLHAVIADITNTPWNERHAYVFDARGGQRAFTVAKQFHVSPFIGMDATHTFMFETPGELLRVSVEDAQEGAPFFVASLALARQPLTRAAMAAVWARYPLMSWRVVQAIYWQALRLWMKRVPYFLHPRDAAKRAARRRAA